MTKRFECGNVVAGCDGVVAADNEEEVLAAVAEHAASVHGMTSLSDDLVAQVKAGITDV